MDEIICINKDEMPYHRARILTRKRFVHNISIMVVRGYSSVGLYNYARPGSLSYWIVMFKVSRGERYKSQSVIEAINAADMQAPIFLSRRENYDYVASVQLQTSVNRT